MIDTTTTPAEPAELLAARAITRFAAVIGDLRQDVYPLNISPRELILREAGEVRRLVDLAERDALELAAIIELGPV